MFRRAIGFQVMYRCEILQSDDRGKVGDILLNRGLMWRNLYLDLEVDWDLKGAFGGKINDTTHCG